MAIREIIVLPDRQLRLVSKPIEKVTAEVRKLADDMFETMYDAPGIGLAAIQVAQPLRLITMDLAKKDEDGESKPRPRVFINPEILSSSAGLNFTLGGTSLLIVVNVTMDTVSQIQSHLIAHQYGDLIKKAKLKTARRR